MSVESWRFRHTLLTLKPTQRQNWMGFAMANHMMGRFPTAIKVPSHLHTFSVFSVTLQVIEAYENIGDENDNAYELSELLLYKNSIMVAAGDLAGALQHLLASCCSILAMLN